jgi:queuine tRNA-ribosyltransferase
MHALGVGHPESIVECARMGYATFDSALPTRDARTGRLYMYTSDPASDEFRFAGRWFRTLYIDDDKHYKTNGPVWQGCDCLACTRYSVGYLRHLHKCGDTLYFRLATLHNLRFMTKLTGLLQAGVHARE